MASEMMALDDHRQVKALIYGHMHVYRFEKRNGMHAPYQSAGCGLQLCRWRGGWLGGGEPHDGGAEFKLHAIADEVKDNRKAASVSWR